MAGIRDQMKKIWIRGMETVGNTASSIAENTRLKVEEMNLQNQRRENIFNIGSMAYVLWQKGETFPEEIQKRLIEIHQIDEKLNDLRAERYTGKTPETQAEKNEKEEASAAPEGAEGEAAPEKLSDEKKDDAAPAAQDHPLDAEPAPAEPHAQDIAESIEALFHQEADVDTMAEKVRDSLEKMEPFRENAGAGASGQGTGECSGRERE